MEHRLLPKRPFLLRAYYDWILENKLTPYLVVDATYYGTIVPQEYVKDGQIVLNLSSTATGNLLLANDHIQFSARFRGIPQDIYIPMGAALAIYARENGDGVMFEPEPIYEELDGYDDEQPIGFEQATDKPKTSHKSKKTTAKSSSSHLRIVK